MITDIALFMLGSVFILTSICGETWRRDETNWKRKLTKLGIFAVICLIVTIVLGVHREIRNNKMRQESELKANENLKLLIDANDKIIELNKSYEDAISRLQKDLQVRKRYEDNLYAEARKHIYWAVKNDANRDRKYREYSIKMNKFDAVMKSQDHNPKAQALISIYGQKRTIEYINEIEK